MTRTRLSLIAVVFCIAVLGTEANAGVRYVKPAASGGANTSDCQSSASPCATVGYAYTQASPGDTIEVAEGTYANETIARKASISSNPVTIQPAAGAAPRFRDVAIRASYLVWKGPMTMRTLDLGDVNLTNRTQFVTVDGITVDHERSATPDWRAMKVWATDNVTVKNSTIGNTLSGTNVGQDSNLIQFSGATYSTNFTIDRVRFHHNDTLKPTGAHNECIYAINIQGFNVRNSTFESCTYYGIFFTDFRNGQPSLRDVTIENNVFATGQNDSGAAYPYAIDMHANVTPNNFRFRYNTFENWVAFSFGGAVSNGFEVKGNIFGLGVVSDSTIGTFACKPGVTFSYNVMPQACGTNSTTASSTAIRSGWLAPSATWGVADDLHLGSTSPAINAGSPTDCPATDLDSNARPTGTGCDAGAYKFGSTPDTRPNPPTDLQVTVS